jgi:fido (protein-threonine AMPylation protein)
MTSSNELRYLAELMKDFPSSTAIDPEEALELIQSRYQSLSEAFAGFLGWANSEDFSTLFSRLALEFHRYLYEGILSNAGQHRQVYEPKGGIVYFGRQQRFRGTSPTNIAAELKFAFGNLRESNPEPIVDAVRFYQRFVQIHPFYDANGRIGRLLVEIYLEFHGYLMNWNQLHRNTQWLKLLNECHKRYGQEVYEEYLQRLVKHWRDCVSAIDELERLD